jgi:hypothetical protein
MRHRMQYIPLNGAYRPPSDTSTFIGGVPNSEELLITAYLRRRAPLPDLLSRGEHVSRENFEARYGIDEKDLEAIVQFANAFGLRVSNIDRSSRRITLSGTALQFSRAFRAKFVYYRDLNWGTYRTTKGPIQVPASLKDVFVGLFGFDTRKQASPRG